MEKPLSRKVGDIPWPRLLIGILAASLVAFTIYKTAVTSFTHDESLTTLLFFPQGEGDIIRYEHPWVPKSIITNNHIFNTLMMKLSESVFGLSEWSLRLPNALSLVAYLWFGYLMIHRLRPAWVLAPAFILLIANPYLLDFFGLARGYGLSVGMMMISLYYLLRYLRGHSPRALLGFHLGGILAVMSNFSLLNYYVAALTCLYLFVLLPTSEHFRQLRRRWSLHITNTGGILILASLLYAPFRVIIENKTVNFGGKQGLLADTGVSLVQRFFYELPVDGDIVRALVYLSLIPIIFISTLTLSRLIQGRSDYFVRHTTLIMTNALLVSIAVMTWIQHIWLEQDYLIERFGLFLYPLFSLQLIFLLAPTGRRRMLRNGLLILLAVFSAFVTLYNLNTNYYLNWKYDKDTKRAMEILRELHLPDTAPQSVHIGIMDKLEPTMNLYRQWWHLEWMAPLTREPAAAADDFLYIREEIVPTLALPSAPRLLFRSEGNGLVLLENKRK